LGSNIQLKINSPDFASRDGQCANDAPRVGRGPYTLHADQRWGLRCRFDFYNLSAVRFVYRYVIQQKARFEKKNRRGLQRVGVRSMGAPKKRDLKSAFGVADLRQFPTTSKTPSLNRIARP
jgi:hypothetical protein